MPSSAAMAALVEDLHPVAGLELLQKSSDLQQFETGDGVELLQV